jgi:hypothetical protein
MSEDTQWRQLRAPAGDKEYRHPSLLHGQSFSYLRDKLEGDNVPSDIDIIISRNDWARKHYILRLVFPPEGTVRIDCVDKVIVGAASH